MNETTYSVAVLGSGEVGRVLADGLLDRGHTVVRGSRNPDKLADWRAAAGDRASTATFAEACTTADMVLLAVKGSAAEAVIDLVGPANLAGKTVIDATNPIADTPPTNGVIAFFTGPNESLMERLQAKAPAAHFVKAFSCVGNALMVDPDLNTAPTMFICGDDPDAKETVTGILASFGWEWADMGGVEAARAIEPLCILWCIRGFKDGEWHHAFKLLT